VHPLYPLATPMVRRSEGVLKRPGLGKPCRCTHSVKISAFCGLQSQQQFYVYVHIFIHLFLVERLALQDRYRPFLLHRPRTLCNARCLSVCLSNCLSVCWQFYVKTTARIFTKISPQLQLCTRKNIKFWKSSASGSDPEILKDC